jgi:hypothetical protein
MTNLRWAAPAAVVLLMAGAARAVTPADMCESDKNKEAGKYAYCRQKAEAKFARTGDGAARTAGLQKCLDKYTKKWPSIEAKAYGACTSRGDQTTIQQLLDDTTDDVASRLGGGPAAGCSADLAECLGACPTAAGTPLQTGQGTCWDYYDSNRVIPCAGTGQDGELQKGLARAYVDNGDGTITDARTGLMWEKLSDDGSIHDKDTDHFWDDAFEVKIAALNAGGGFAGHTDWRVPNVNELQSIVNYGAVWPAVSPAFNTGCVASCTVTSCSCTQPSEYWSSTTYQYSPQYAWAVEFRFGSVREGGYNNKSSKLYVRAVRGGS